MTERLLVAWTTVVARLDVQGSFGIPARAAQTAYDRTTVPVDVQTQIEIERPRHEVAAYASDPDNAPAWYENIKSVEWKSPKPLAVGAEIAFTAHFLGRRLAYVYRIRELVPDERLVMSTADGPFPMETTYTWEDTAGGATSMTLRNRGQPTGFGKLSAPLLARAIRRANEKDLRRLKHLLDAHGAS